MQHMADTQCGRKCRHTAMADRKDHSPSRCEAVSDVTRYRCQLPVGHAGMHHGSAFLWDEAGNTVPHFDITPYATVASLESCSRPAAEGVGPDVEVTTCQERACGGCDASVRLLERAAIVKWLRDTYPIKRGVRLAVDAPTLADAIEAGDHHE